MVNTDWTDGAEAFTDAERLRTAVESRRRERWRRDRRWDDVGLVGVLLGSLGEPVLLHMASGATLTGTVAATGAHVTTLDRTGTDPGRAASTHAGSAASTCWVACEAVVAVEVRGEPSFDRASDPALTIEGVFENLRGERRDVVVGLRSGATLRGQVVGVGAEVGAAVTLHDPLAERYVAFDPSWVESVSA